MIPVLYESDETNFTSHGLGRLSDCLYVRSHQALNGIYEIALEYPDSGHLYSELTDRRIVLAKPDDFSVPQPFRIYEVTERTKTVQIMARHISYDLIGKPVAPFSTVGVVPALNGLVTNSIVPHNFTVWTDINNAETTYSQTVPIAFRTLLGGVEGSILDRFGGEYEWDRFTVKLHAHRGSDKGVQIRYAKNLLSFENIRSTEATYNGCLAFWSSNNDETVVTGAVRYVENREDFPTDLIFNLDVSSEFEEQPTVEQLNTRADRYMESNSFGVPFSDTLTVSHINLADTQEYANKAALEHVALGDTLHVIYKKYNVSMRMIEYVYDVISERYLSTTLGKKKSSLNDSIKAIAQDAQNGAVEQAVSMMQVEIQHATDVISGGTGGHVVIGTDANGKPNEIYIMDTDDMATAVNVLRMNYAGIAFSQTGLNGSFTTAWTIDSHFVADFVTAGTLNGNLIRAGSILTSALEVAVQTVLDGVKMNFSFLDDGLHIAEKNASGTITTAYNSLFTNLGMRVINTSTNEATLIAERDTVTAENLTANQYFRMSVPNAGSRFQEYHSSIHNDDEVGCYWEAI